MYPKMDPEVKRRWVQALRSGDYVQGRRRLLRIDPSGVKMWCCLGVLCDLAVRDSVLAAPAPERSTADGWDGDMSYVGDAFGVRSVTLPPRSVAEWSGLSGDAMLHLTKLNDNADRTFKQIATWIEDEL